MATITASSGTRLRHRVGTLRLARSTCYLCRIVGLTAAALGASVLLTDQFVDPSGDPAAIDPGLAVSRLLTANIGLNLHLLGGSEPTAGELWSGCRRCSERVSIGELDWLLPGSPAKLKTWHSEGPIDAIVAADVTFSRDTR